MSGATEITDGGRYWRATLFTPRMNFARPPPGVDAPDQERSFHDGARAEFESAFEATRGPLDAHLESLSTRFGLVRMDAPGTDLMLAVYDDDGRRWVKHLCMGVSVRAAAALPEEDHAVLAESVLAFLDALRQRTDALR